jgi:hypothetical protein
MGTVAGDPAAIVYRWGRGTVGLLSPHPEADQRWLSEIRGFPDSPSYDLGLYFYDQVFSESARTISLP